MTTHTSWWGDTVFRQSMGTDPAVDLANHYLFMLERQFFESVLGLLHHSPQQSGPWREAMTVLHAFAYTRRYIEDLIMITYSSAEEVQQYFYSSTISTHGIAGIYPDFLEGTFAEPARAVDFLDLHIAPKLLAKGGFGPLVTCLYDKRRSEAFAMVPISRFPHFQSLLSARCKYGVLGSRLIHMSRIISDPDNFEVEAARLICDMVLSGYSLSRLLAQCGILMLRIATDLGLAPGTRIRRAGDDGGVCRPDLFTAIWGAACEQI